MRKTLRRALIAFVLPLLVVMPRAWGWGSPGHMAVAYVAYQKLDPAIKTRVQQLLKLNPNYSVWQAYIPAGTSQDDTDLYLFMMAATWPDEIKAIHSYKNDGDSPPADTAQANSNIGYSDMFMHKYWHFVDLPISPDNTAPADTPTPNAETQINVFRKVLASNATDALKSYDLVWTMHLVGDVHQPLHCATRFIGSKSDGGGNDVVISASPKDLHGYWDSLPGLGGTKNFSTAVKFASTLPDADVTKADDTKVDDWAQESFALAQSDAYAKPPINDTDPTTSSTITASYHTKALADAKLRVALGGARLAKLLNTNLK